MSSQRKHALFSLYKKQTKKGLFWYVRFWNKNELRYTLFRSTGIEVWGKRGRRAQAEAVAHDMLGSLCFNASKKSFVEYLDDFWSAESDYAQEAALIKKQPLSTRYIHENQRVVKTHVALFKPFKNIRLEGITTGLIRDFMLYEAKRGVSGDCINKALQAMRVPFSYALSREEAVKNPFENIQPAVHERKEKGILIKEEVLKLINADVKNWKEHTAVLLGALCGMRVGEIRGLRWSDIKEDCIDIKNNWQDMEGNKKPKYGSFRAIPIGASIKGAFSQVEKKGDFVFANGKPDGKPLCMSWFQSALTNELENLGIPDAERRERNISFHSLRHTFITLGRMAGISDIEVRAMTGHKGAAIMEHYSHARQAIDIKSTGDKMEAVYNT
jgi:integrase